MKINDFNRANLAVLRDEIEEALAPVGEKFGVSLSLGNARFSGNNVNFKLEGATLGEDGEVNSKVSEDFKFLASFYGLDPHDLNRQFRYNGKTYRIVGLNRRAHQYPIVGEEISTGKRYKFAPKSVVGNLLPAQKTAS